MGFNLESRKNNEIKEAPDNQVNSEKLSETEETAENFDDCSLSEVKDSNGNEVDARTLEDSEDDFEDCEAKLEDIEEYPELADDDLDDFNNFGKKNDGEYVAKVTYTADSEIRHEGAKAQIQEAYNECDDSENMTQLKENAKENKPIEVVNAEVVERLDESSDKTEEAEYDEVEQEYEEAQAYLEDQQEGAKDYEESLEEKNENTESISTDADGADATNIALENTDGSLGEDTFEVVEQTGLYEDDVEEEKEKSLDVRVDLVFDKDDVTSSEVRDLAAENAKALNAIKGEQSDIEAEIRRRFGDVESMKRGTNDYKQALQEYNALISRKNEIDEKVADLTDRQEHLEKKSLELRDTQISRSETAAANSSEYRDTVAFFDSLMLGKDAVGDSKNGYTHENHKVEKFVTGDESILNRAFLTNDGERITYEGAINRITESAAQYMDSMNVKEAVKASAIADMKSALLKQQKEAEARALGDHGIRHIYGNFERGEKYLMTRDDVSDEQKLAVLVSQVYHDEGYTDKPNNGGKLKEDCSDKEHDAASLNIWREKHQEIFQNIFSPDLMVSIEDAIGTHNSENVDNIQKNTGFERDPVVSTVHICDKLALSQREKFSELLLSDPKLVELTEGMNSIVVILQDEKFGLYKENEKGEPKLTDQGKELLDQYHRVIVKYIESKGYDAEYADRLKTAVYKDVNFESGRFSSRMNYIYTPSDCYQYNAKTGRNEITVCCINHTDGTSSYEQIEKMFKDLGVPEEKVKNAAKEAIENGRYDFDDERELRGLYVRVESITRGEIKAVRNRENDDLKEVHEKIEIGRAEYQELCDELAKYVDKKGIDISHKDFQTIRRSGISNKYKNFDECNFSEKQAIVREMIPNIVAEVVSSKILKKVNETLH